MAIRYVTSSQADSPVNIPSSILYFDYPWMILISSTTVYVHAVHSVSTYRVAGP